MNTAVSRKNFTVAMDWQQRTLEQWLEQYGSWLLQDCHFESLNAKGTLGSLLDSVQGTRTDCRRRALPRCNISLEQALAVEDMLTHVLQTEKSKKIKTWLGVVIAHYVDAYTEEDIAKRNNVTAYSVKRDKVLGLVRIATRLKFRSYLME